MAIAKAPKKPWIAALLALVLGGPGCFYLGWRRGVVATLAWLPFMTFLLLGVLCQIKLGHDGTFEPAAFSFVFLQTAFAWKAYCSCKRGNAEETKAADSADPGATQTYGVTHRTDRNMPMGEPGCSKKLRDIGVFVVVGSGFALWMGALHFNMLPMGEIGNFAYYISPYVCCMGAWGLATGIGLLRAWRWARISMLVFCSFLAVCGAFGIVAFLCMPSGNVAGWTLFLIKAGTLLYCIIPVAIGAWWFIYFTRNNVKAHFESSGKAL